jgi:DNA processing protein
MQGLAPLYALLQCTGISTITCFKLADYLSCELSQIPSQPIANLLGAGLTRAQIAQLRADYTQPIERLYAWQAQANDIDRHIILCTDEHYPQTLLQVSDRPLLLFAEGNIELLACHQIAIVGARRASEIGKQQAHNFAQQLALRHWVITSGLAQGIDAQAHRGALSAQGGTIAVLGHGHQHMYPKHHCVLRDQILKAKGCVVSEFLPHQPPKPTNFPKRNRIISGLSMGTFVVEAQHKSGSLITANQALNENRTVFAMPGRIDDVNVSGCHALIKQGALLVDHVDDIDLYFTDLEKPNSCPISNNNNKYSQENLSHSDLLDSVGFEITAIDTIAAHSNLPLPQLLAKLLEYELRGKVAAVSGGYIKLRGDNYV